MTVRSSCAPEATQTSIESARNPASGGSAPITRRGEEGVRDQPDGDLHRSGVPGGDHPGPDLRAHAAGVRPERGVRPLRCDVCNQVPINEGLPSYERLTRFRGRWRCGACLLAS